MQSPWKVITAFVGVFIAGSIFGGLLALRVVRQRELQNRMVQVTMAPEVAPSSSSSATPVGSAGNVTTTVTPSPSGATTSTSTPGTTSGTGTAVTTTTAPETRPAPVRPVVAQTQALPASMIGQAPALMRRHVERLDLTPEQKERILPLINRAGKDLTRQQQTNFRETGVILQHLQEDVARELNPIQRTRLEEMIERQRLMVEQRAREDQDILKKAQLEKQERRALKQAPKENVKPKGKPPEDGNN